MHITMLFTVQYSPKSLELNHLFMYSVKIFIIRPCSIHVLSLFVILMYSRIGIRRDQKCKFQLARKYFTRPKQQHAWKAKDFITSKCQFLPFASLSSSCWFSWTKRNTLLCLLWCSNRSLFAQNWRMKWDCENSESYFAWIDNEHKIQGKTSRLISQKKTRILKGMLQWTWDLLLQHEKDFEIRRDNNAD